MNDQPLYPNTDYEHDDGDPCPECGSRNTERIDLLIDEPEFSVWFCQCGSCAHVFETTVEHAAERGEE